MVDFAIRNFVYWVVVVDSEKILYRDTLSFEGAEDRVVN